MNTKEKRIVVMGGSFNPPTLAHYKLMKVAIDALDADKGLFVPVSDAYLRRKMSHDHPPIILSPELRVAMLRAMSEDDRMAVCEKEIGTDLVYKIIGAAMKVHSEMNWGLLVSKGLVQDDPSFQSGSDVPVPLTL